MGITDPQVAITGQTANLPERSVMPMCSFSRVFAALTFAILLALPIPSLADNDGVIILRLEDIEPTREVAPQATVDPEIVVPPSQAKPPAPPDIKGPSAVLMDVATGQVLYSKKPHYKRPNASTTKIMTAILLIENAKMTDKVTASKNACKTRFTSIHLKPGEKITVKDLLMALMIRSANDAAVATAEHVAGSVSKFAKMMNKKAKAIGCKNTNFVTPNGLHDKNHYSTALDLCLMARYAFRYPVFNEAIRTRKHTLDSRTVNREDLVVFTKQKFMKEYSGADGVKSGYVKQAGYCYVGSATRENWRLVSCVLKSDNAGKDTAALMDYGFNNFTPITVAKGGRACREAEVTGGARDAVSVAPAKDLRVIVSKTGGKITTRFRLEPVQAPIEQGAKLGTITAAVNGKDVMTVDLRAVDAVEISVARKMTPWLKTGGLLAACLVVGGKYGAAITKTSRRRRRRVTASLRNPNRYR